MIVGRMVIVPMFHLSSAATLGLIKMFRLSASICSITSTDEIQHWGTSFSSLVGRSVKPPQVDGDDPVAETY